MLTSRDFVFIKECIYSKPLHYVENGHKAVRDLVGWPQEKEWLYDIVSNVHSVVDVDKLDYFARDERRATRESGEVSHDTVDRNQCSLGRLSLAGQVSTKLVCRTRRSTLDGELSEEEGCVDFGGL